MASQIEERYGVPLPIDILWRELEQRYGAVAVAELRRMYRQATQRYSRAATLNKMRRLIAYNDSDTVRYRMRPDKEQRWRAALADPQAYIDGKL